MIESLGNQRRTYFLTLMVLVEAPNHILDYIKEISENKDENKMFCLDRSIFVFFKTCVPFQDLILSLGENSKTEFFLSDITDNNFSVFMNSQISDPLIKFLDRTKIKFENREIVDLSEASIEQLEEILKKAIEDENFEYCSEIKKLILDKSK